MRIFPWLLVILLATAAWAQPDVRLRVTREEYAAIRIAIADSTRGLQPSLENMHGNFLNHFNWALEVTGYLEIVTMNDEDKPQAIIILHASAGAASIAYEIRLVDHPSKATIFKRRYVCATETVRSTAYVAADDVIFALTGRYGIASSQIAFVAGKKPNSHLYVINLDGSGLRRLTSLPGIVMSPAWSPSGTKLAYVSYEKGKPDLYVVDLRTLSTTRFLAFDGLNATPAWSPDGKSLAVTLSKDGNPEIYVISIDGKSMRRVTFYSGIDCSPTWAPNGLEIAFTSDRTGSPQIFITDLDGISVRRITHQGSYNTSPAWSPEGDLIAYVSRIDGRFQICTVDPFGINVNVLTEIGNNEDPAWSPDGMHIAFSSTIGGKTGIYIMKKDGSFKRLIVEGFESARNPSWTRTTGLTASQREGS